MPAIKKEMENETVNPEALMLMQYILKKNLFEKDPCLERYHDFQENHADLLLYANPGPFSQFLCSAVFARPSRIPFLDVWTGLFDRYSLLRYKLSLALALLECSPAWVHSVRGSGQNVGSFYGTVWKVAKEMLRYAGIAFSSFFIVAFLYYKYILRPRSGSPGLPPQHLLEFSDKDFNSKKVSRVGIEAEMLVRLAKKHGGKKILDIGTGTGYIAIRLAQKGCAVTASDIDRESVETARRNAQSNGVEMRIVLSDLFENIQGTFDTILFNLPIAPGASNSSGLPIQRIRMSRILTAIGVRIGLTLYGRKRSTLIDRFLIEALPHLAADGHIFLYITMKEFRHIVKHFPHLKPVGREKGLFHFLAVGLQRG
ncbi:MAG: methyltransferase domain-containing protein [Desulfobacteraceae bacterium]|nr:MAG: methyltransferase domain-containing protein [Desulfobacteraceae bacterium]